MNSALINADRMTEWNALMEREPSFSLLQSWEWGVFKEELGWKVYRIGVEDQGHLVAGAQLLIKDLPFGLSLAYIPRGPVGNWLEIKSAECLFPAVCELAHENGAVFLKIEPPVASYIQADNVLEGCGFRKSKVNNQPQATILLDLRQGQAGILEQMRKKTRQYIHRAEREGITICYGSEEDLPAYYELMRLTGKREHFAARSLKYYQSEWKNFSKSNQGILLLAYYQGRLVAARTAYCLGLHAAEFHAGSLIIPGMHANYLLVWEAIKWAITKGCLTYDLWGIPDEIAGAEEDPAGAQGKGDLWGVYQFKRGFSHNIFFYLGAYDIVFSRPLYLLFNTALSWGKSWEQIAALLDSHPFGNSSKHGSKSYGGTK